MYETYLNQNVPTVIIDNELLVLKVNEQAVQILNCTSAIMIGLSIATLFNLNRGQFAYTSKDLDNHFKINKLLTFTTSFFYKGKLEQLSWHIEKIAGEEKNTYAVYTKLTEYINETDDQFSISLTKYIMQAQLSVRHQEMYSVLRQIINFLPGKAHFKRAGDFAYMMSNQATLKLLGLKSADELIHKDDYKLAKNMKWRWPSKFAQELQDIDAKVIQLGQPIVGLEEKPYIDAQGHLVLHSLTKIPVFNKSQALGILTFAIDKSNLQNLEQLRNLYYQFYPNKHSANTQFLKHIGLHKHLKNNLYFNNDDDTTLTTRELDTLILLTKGYTAKEIAINLNISYRTIEKYIESLRTKFSMNNVHQILTLIYDTTLENLRVDFL